MSDLTLSRASLAPGDTIDISVTLTNPGARAGYDTAQLYLRDVLSRQTRPKMALRGFGKVLLQPGDSRW